jgi:hypothetical protein
VERFHHPQIKGVDRRLLEAHLDDAGGTCNRVDTDETGCRRGELARTQRATQHGARVSQHLPSDRERERGGRPDFL